MSAPTLSRVDRDLAAGIARDFPLTPVARCRATGNHLVAQNDARELLPPATPVQIAWIAVGKAWQDGVPQCDGCVFRHDFTEYHPYGEGMAMEFLSECTLGDSRSHTPDQCPAYAQSLQEQTA